MELAADSAVTVTALAADTLDPVALDRVADLLRDHEPNSCARRAVGLASRDEQDEMRRRRALADGLHAQKVRPTADSTLLAEREARNARGPQARARDQNRSRDLARTTRTIYFA